MRSSDLEEGVPRKMWQTVWFWLLAGVGACAALSAAVCLDIPGFVAGETDILGNYRFVEEREEARASMSTMERVHAELFPAWLIASANRLPEADQKYEALREAVTDEQLRAVLAELRAAIESGEILRGPAQEPRALDAGAQEEEDPLYLKLLWRWNARLEELGEPYYVTGSVTGTSAGPALLSEFYKRLADPSVEVGERQYPTVILQRIDRTNIVEAYLGVAHRGGIAIVVTDRILELATDAVWLMLNEETAPDDELSAAYVADLRAETRAGLGDEVFARLAQAAVHRRRLLDTMEEVRSRRSCGNTMQFGIVAWDGFDPRSLDRLGAYAERDKLQPCPTMKFEEVDALGEASNALQSEETKEAMQTLVAWLTRVIALHEARHVADELELGRLEDPETCPGCPEWMHSSVRAELSAYVATIAWSEAPATALFQACTIRGGPHRQAVAFLNQQLGRRCSDPVPRDLVERAREIQQTLFGKATPMRLQAQFPQQLEIHRFQYR